MKTCSRAFTVLQFTGFENEVSLVLLQINYYVKTDGEIPLERAMKSPRFLKLNSSKKENCLMKIRGMTVRHFDSTVAGQ